MSKAELKQYVVNSFAPQRIWLNDDQVDAVWLFVEELRDKFPENSLDEADDMLMRFCDSCGRLTGLSVWRFLGLMWLAWKTELRLRRRLKEIRR